MNTIFVDTNAWLAIHFKRDGLHDEAIRINKQLLKDGNRYVTTNFVLDETYTGLLMKAGHSAAVTFGENIRKSALTRVFYISKAIEEEAWQIFVQYSDKQFSFTDCTSFVVMKHLGIHQAFTNDHHFEQMNFTRLLKPTH